MVTEFGRGRVIDTPIAEHGYFGAAVGAAATGLRPISELMFNDFIGFALDPILNQGAKMRYMFGGKAKIPLTVRTVHGAGAGAAAQHSQTLYGMFGSIPGVKVVVPSNPYDAKGLLKASIRDEDPVIFMESEVMYGEKGDVPQEEYIIPIGKSDVKRQGNDVTIVSYNKMMKVALGAAGELEKEGISAEVVDLRTIRPLDWKTVLESVKKTNRLVIVDEQWPMCSVSSELAYHIQKDGFDYLDAPIRRLTSADAPLHYAPNLVALALPDVPRTVKLVKEVMYLKK